MREYTTFVYDTAAADRIPLRPLPRLALRSETVRELVFEPTDAELERSSAFKLFVGGTLETGERDEFIRWNLENRKPHDA